MEIDEAKKKTRWDPKEIRVPKIKNRLRKRRCLENKRWARSRKSWAQFDKR